MQADKRKIVLFFWLANAGISAQQLDRQGWKASVFSHREKAALVQKEREDGQRLYEFHHLQSVKLALLKGKLNAARASLGLAGQHSGQFKAVQTYYRALIAFLQNRFEDSLKLIAEGQFNSFEKYPHICVLRLVNLAALGDFRNFGREKISCTLSTGAHAYQDHLWPEVVTDMHYQRSGEREKMRNWGQVLAGLDESRKDERGAIDLWAKGMLFLNLSAFEAGIQGLSDEAFENAKYARVDEFLSLPQQPF